MSDEAREAAWMEYKAKMLALDAKNNLAGRGLIPSWRDWHAGWDAAVAAQAQPVQIDREALVTALMQHPWLAHREEGWPTGYCPTCDRAVGGGCNSPAHAEHLADAVIAYLAAQPVTGTVSTLPELAALPRLTMLRDRGRVWQKLGGVMPYKAWQAADGGFSESDEVFFSVNEYRLPFTILWKPEDAR